MENNQNCRRCGLYKTASKVCIPGRGSNKPVYMFVGQAPGREEDLLGKCFIGPAGQLLIQAIEEYNLKPCYLSNTTKCFPPDDRNPKVDEIKACLPYLKEEILRLKPKVIVALGNISLEALTGKCGITDYSGNVVHEYSYGGKVFALLHPSYILRYPRNMPKFEMHLRSLMDLFAEKKEEEKVFDFTTEEAIYHIDKSQHPIAFDYETDGTFKQNFGKIRCCGFYANDKAFVVNAEEPRFNEMMKLFLASDCEKIAFNCVFENRWSIDEFGIEPVNLRYDPYLMHFILHEEIAHDLESVASQYLKVKSWDVSSIMKENEWTHATIPYKHLYPYCGMDVRVTYQLVKPLLKKLIEEETYKFYKDFTLPLAKLCAKFEHRGMMIDRKWAMMQSDVYKSEMKSIMTEITKQDVVKHYIKEKSAEKKHFTFNLNSGMQIGDIIYGKLKFKTKILTGGTGRPSTAEAVLTNFRGKHPFIDKYLEWKKQFTIVNNFLDKFPTYCDRIGLIHPSFNPGRVVTTRLSVTEPPAQAVPEEPKVRGMFISRFDGGVILSADYDALELRLMASESNEKRMLEIFYNGDNPHDIAAQSMFGKGYTKSQRSLVKRINFGIPYGITEHNLSYEFNISYQEAMSMMERHRKVFPNIYVWMKEQHEFVKKNGYIKNKLGQIRHLPEVLDETLPKWRVERICRQAGNFPIQSLGGTITNTAGVMIDEQLKDFESLIFHIVHDSVMVDIYPGEEEKVSQIVRSVMEEGIESFCQVDGLCWLKVKLTTTQKISKRWDN